MLITVVLACFFCWPSLFVFWFFFHVFLEKWNFHANNIIEETLNYHYDATAQFYFSGFYIYIFLTFSLSMIAKYSTSNRTTDKNAKATTSHSKSVDAKATASPKKRRKRVGRPKTLRKKKESKEKGMWSLQQMSLEGRRMREGV